MEVVTEVDLVARMGGPGFLWEDPCGPAAAFFWAAAALRDRPTRDVVVVAGGCGCECAWAGQLSDRRPTVNAFLLLEKKKNKAKTLVVTVRGTTTASDVKSDVSVRRSWPSFERKVRKAVVGSTAAERLVEADLDGEASGARTRGPVLFHHGFYALASKALPAVIRTIHEALPSRIVFYGHSLGAAVASFLYRWVRIELGPSVDVRLAVMSCPAICDARCFSAWFGPLGDDGERARHYYTRGDVVVRRIPGVASLDSHATRRGEYEAAPWVERAKAKEDTIKSRLKRLVAATLLSHTTLVPETLVPVAGSNGRPLAVRERRPSGVVLSFSNAKVSTYARGLLREISGISR